jgi:exopolysaccharide production protein ExoQ
MGAARLRGFRAEGQFVIRSWSNSHAAQDAERSPVAATPQWFDWVATLYVLVIASGALGCLDVIASGMTEDGQIVNVHPFNKVAWPLAYLMFAMLSLRRLSEVRDATLRIWWALPVPLLAGASVLWSLDPMISANAALRLAVSTAIGIYIGATFGLAAITRMVFWILLVTVGISVLVSLAGLDFAIMFNDKARGIFYHKNQLGSRAVILVASSLAYGIIQRRARFALAGILLAFVALVMARSATGFVTAVAVIVAVALLVALRGGTLAIAFRSALIGAATTVLATLVIVSGIDPVTGLLELLDRDPTLTGRSWLWQAAWAQIERRPLLGTGYEAFWAVAVDWRTLQVLERMGQIGHFHSTFFEVGVQLGAIGLVGAIVTLVGFVWRGLDLSFRLDTTVGIWWMAFATAVIVPALAEYELFAKHSFAGILMAATAVAGTRTLERIRQGTVQRTAPGGVVR